jgi:hypothetical protein
MSGHPGSLLISKSIAAFLAKRGIHHGWAVVAATSVATSPAGLTRTTLASYVPAFVIAGALCIGAAGLTLLLRPGRLDRVAGALSNS